LAPYARQAPLLKRILPKPPGIEVIEFGSIPLQSPGRGEKRLSRDGKEFGKIIRCLLFQP
jgi:hypothetical protein